MRLKDGVSQSVNALSLAPQGRLRAGKELIVSRKRKGFTLVEILIVVIVIGLLAGAMLVVAARFQARTRASVIVANMRTLQEAAMLYLAGNGRWFPEEASNGNANKKDAGTFLLPYLDRKLAAKFSATDNQYFVWLFEEGNGDGKFYVVCKVDDRFENYETRQALEKIAASPPFFNADGEDHPFKAVKNPGTGYSGNTQITLLILRQSFGD